MNFLGIPIDGTISEFQNKLTTKGIRKNQAKSNEAPVGQRVFNGQFQRYNSEITVYYNRKSNQVYKVKVVIPSKKLEVIQEILKKSIKTIEEKYIYYPLHDLEDDTRLHYQYFILPTKESKECTGVIHLRPSGSYYLPDEDHPEKGFEFASYIITFEYEDAINTSKLTPSTTEPKNLWGFTCGKPENYDNFFHWANNFMKNECYEKCIYYLTWVLDYYKYGCAPQDPEFSEDMLDQIIMSLQSLQIGRIKTAYSGEYANVFWVPNEEDRFKCIEFGVCSEMYQIKLYAGDIFRHISAMESLKLLYAEKKKFIAGTNLSENWTEDINLSMPALIGQDRQRGEFGDMDWQEKTLTMRFKHFKQELCVEVNFDDYRSIFLFRSEEEIDDYLNFLRSIPK